MPTNGLGQQLHLPPPLGLSLHSLAMNIPWSCGWVTTGTKVWCDTTIYVLFTKSEGQGLRQQQGLVPGSKCQKPQLKDKWARCPQWPSPCGLSAHPFHHGGFNMIRFLMCLEALWAVSPGTETVGSHTAFRDNAQVQTMGVRSARWQNDGQDECGTSRKAQSATKPVPRTASAL